MSQVISEVLFLQAQNMTKDRTLHLVDKNSKQAKLHTLKEKWTLNQMCFLKF